MRSVSITNQLSGSKHLASADVTVICNFIARVSAGYPQLYEPDLGALEVEVVFWEPIRLFVCFCLFVCLFWLHVNTLRVSIFKQELALEVLLIYCRPAGSVESFKDNLFATAKRSDMLHLQMDLFFSFTQCWVEGKTFFLCVLHLKTCRICFKVTMKFLRASCS